MRGKVSVLSQFRTNHRDHPRVCGEKADGDTLNLRFVGSPPRMRGKVTFVFLACKPMRITPAYAGKRHRSLLSCATTPDHSRICGEKTAHVSGGQRTSGITPVYAGKRCHSIAGFAVCGEKTCPHRCRTAVWGSPPHMRGKDLSTSLSNRCLGITPAYAGKSS